MFFDVIDKMDVLMCTESVFDIIVKVFFIVFTVSSVSHRSARKESGSDLFIYRIYIFGHFFLFLSC